MAFSKKVIQQREETQSAEVQQTQNQAPSQDYIDVEEEIQTKDNPSQESGSQDNKKPLLHEVTIIQTQKGGGTKRWKCNLQLMKKSQIFCSKQLMKLALQMSFKWSQIMQQAVSWQERRLKRSHSGLELLKVAKTRYGSHYILLRRLTRCREALVTTVIVRSWKDWLNYGDEEAKELGREVTATIKDEEFWDEVDNILAITRPLYRMIKFGDGEGQKMGEIYEKMDCMIGEINDIMKNNKHQSDHEKMNEIMLKRWEKMHVPMHCLGFALNPYFYDRNYLQSAAPGGEPRRAPNCDLEVVEGVLSGFDRIGEDEEERRVLRQQLAKFQGKEGMFGTLAAKVDAVTMSPTSWWSTYGAEAPQLSEIALKVLSQPTSSSSAERVWSTYSYIHSVKRNRLNSVRADKLIYIHSNIGLISRATSGYKDGPYRKWDVNAETSYLDDSATKLEDLRCKDDELDEEDLVPTSKRQRYED